ncbi:GDSL-type esterase/lipase family protein [Peribacillus kribbensis]|uniref:GDSL-type esterase/lipase family protein n=1 Tax=Peribacillus kribbensis TaxID=356658 RepID=UPI00041CB8AC|nr:GDSL-type esterase/lipase family protein [Peribacillus kribbensis]
MELQYTALGDSITVGMGASFLAPGFAPRYRSLASSDLGERIELRNFARIGFETADVLCSLERRDVQKSISDAEIITITAGGNDLIHTLEKTGNITDPAPYREALEHAQTNFEKILNRIYQIKEHKSHTYIIRLCNLYNPFPEVPPADKWIMAFNQHLQKLCGAPHVKIADLYSAFKGHESDYLSVDRVHPSNLGHQAIAKELRRLEYAPLAKIKQE